MDSRLSSRRSRKQETSSPRCALPAFRNVGVAGWKRPGEHLVHEAGREGFVALPEKERGGDHALLKTFQVCSSVERLQRIGSEELERPEEGLETVPGPAGAFVQVGEELRSVRVEERPLVVVVRDQPLQALGHAGEGSRVRDDVLAQVLVGGFLVLVELDRPVRGEQVQLCVEGVVVLPRADPGAGGGFWGDDGHAVFLSVDVRLSEACSQKRVRPLFTCSMSRCVPSSSKRYSSGTWHFTEMTGPARQ